MRYLLSIVLLFISLSFVFSQSIMDYKEFYVGTGYAAGFRNFGNTNRILDRFNSDGRFESDTIREDDYGDFRSPNGITFSLGMTQGFFNIEAGFSQLQQRRKAKFSVGNDLLQKDARIRINSYFIGSGLFFPVSRSFGFGANAFFDYHKMKLSTRQAVEKSINRASFISPVKQDSYGTTIQMKFYFGRMNDHGTKLMIIPYYSIVFSDLDGAAFDKMVNPALAASDPIGDTKQKMSHMGIKFVITYSVRK